MSQEIKTLKSQLTKSTKKIQDGVEQLEGLKQKLSEMDDLKQKLSEIGADRKRAEAQAQKSNEKQSETIAEVHRLEDLVSALRAELASYKSRSPNMTPQAPPMAGLYNTPHQQHPSMAPAMNTPYHQQHHSIYNPHAPHQTQHSQMHPSPSHTQVNMTSLNNCLLVHQHPLMLINLTIPFPSD